MTMNANNPAYDVPEFESEVAETRDDLFWDLQVDGSIMVDGVSLELNDLIESMSDDDKNNIIHMLFRRTTRHKTTNEDEAREFTCEKILEEFTSTIPDEIIFRHYEDEQRPF